MRFLRFLWDRPLLLLPLPPLFWAGNLVLGRALAGSFPPVSLAVGRWIVALVCLLPFVLGALRTQWPALLRARGIVLACGAFGIAGYNALGYLALQSAPAASVAFLNSTLPLMVPLAAFVLGVEKVSGRTLAGIAISFVGVAWIVARGDLSTLSQLSFQGGEPLVLIAVANYALYSVLLRRRPADLDPLLFLAATMAAGLLVLLPFWIWELAAGATIPTAPGPLAAVLYIGIFASLIAFIIWNRCVASLGPSVTGASFHLVALFTAVLAFVLLGEPVRLFHLVGAALILGGFGLAALSGRASAPVRSEADASNRSA
ncbi:DMT family transporter [Bosea sp. BH3]|uniref:DMT family transporter n=1 Tax=Bosea sp. BH3 TaxID=2871701 RepID=UPI0021CB3081|nr:DMT family transporter [Bosea sp. BH3]MCU4181173.1 DMT family transporter [Bosea sp. BH3]